MRRPALVALLVSGCAFGHAMVRTNDRIEENLGHVRFVWTMTRVAAFAPEPEAALPFVGESIPGDAVRVGDLSARWEYTGWGDEGARRTEEDFHATLATLAAEMGGTHFRVVDLHTEGGYVSAIGAVVFRMASAPVTDASALATPRATLRITEVTHDAHVVEVTSGGASSECVAPCTLAPPPGPASVRVTLGDHVFTRDVTIPTGHASLLVSHDDGQIAVGVGLLVGYVVIETVSLLWAFGLFTHDWIVNDVGLAFTGGSSVLLGLGMGQLLTHVGDDVRVIATPTAVSLRISPLGLTLRF